MRIELRKTADVRAYDRNPRHNSDAVEAVAKSIRQFGFRQPIVVDAQGTIVVGHTRWKAAQQIGLETVPVHVAGELTPEQAKAYRLADNQTASLSAWDPDLLPLELADLRELGVDLAITGFSADELDKLLAPIDDTDGKTDEDAVPEAPEDPASEPGRVYTLGRHRLLVGDATSRDDVKRLLNGDKANLLLTDPPYGVAYVGKTADALTIENDAMGESDFRAFLAGVHNADHVMRPGASFYVFHADSRGYEFRGACQDVGWQVRQCLTWVKNAMVMGRQDYQWRHEPCLYGWKGGAGHQWLADRSQTTVVEFDRPARSADHPTMKPVALVEYLVGNSAKRGEIVLDLFAGAGSTVIAAERSGRIARVMELDPRYADVIRRRWAEFVHGDDCDWAASTGEAG